MKLKSLGEDVLFRRIISASFALSVVSMIIIAVTERRCPCFAASCFEEFLVIFKFPFQVFAAGLALAAIRGMVFRSEQTARQIDETIKQNTFKNYFDHKKDFFDLLKSLEDTYQIIFIDKKTLYEKLFPGNSPANFDIISRGTSGNKSSLEFWVGSYNNAIGSINKNPDNYLSLGNASSFINWLAGFVVDLAQSNIAFSAHPNVYSISAFHDKLHVFGDMKKLNKFPVELSKAISDIGKVYEILVHYCFF
jgi:hypothetical protein